MLTVSTSLCSPAEMLVFRLISTKRGGLPGLHVCAKANLEILLITVLEVLPKIKYANSEVIDMNENALGLGDVNCPFHSSIRQKTSGPHLHPTSHVITAF